jgi:hypothetical protein
MQSVQAAAAAPAMPQEHLALETSIREIQGSYENPIPEERFKQIISEVALPVFQSVITASQFRPVVGKGLKEVTALVLVDKDTKAGRVGTDQEMNRVFGRLGESGVGKEALYRVAHAVSLMAIQNQALFRTTQLPGLDEVHTSAFMFASQPLESAINRAAPHALETTRFAALTARRAEQAEAGHADQPVVVAAAQTAPERVEYTDLEQRSIETAARLLSLIWIATQLSREADRIENEREQRLLGEELSRITPMFAANREQREPVPLKLESSLPTMPMYTERQVDWEDRDWTTDPLEWEKTKQYLREAELKGEKALREEMLEKMTKIPRISQPSPSEPVPKYDLDDEFRTQLFRNWTLLASNFPSPVGMTSEPKLRRGFPSSERMGPLDSSFEGATEALKWLENTHSLLERELSNSAAGRKILELLVQERDRIRSAIPSQPSGPAAEKSSPPETK